MIECRNVTKKFGVITAVDDFTLTIEKGAFFGLLGPNGAGKTTLIRMIVSLSRPDSGEILIGGMSADRNNTELKQTLGVVPQYSPLEGELTAGQNLEYHAMLYGIPKPERKRRIDEMLDFAELSERRDDKAKTFSGGMMRKLMIAKSLIHKPSVMILDEPTTGLDAMSRRKIWDLLKELNKDGLTILLTTHYIEEAQALCSKVGMINQGKLEKTGTPASVIGECGDFALEYFDGAKTVLEFFSRKEDALAAAAGLKNDFKIRESNLEDAFIKLTNKRLDEQ